MSGRSSKSLGTLSSPISVFRRRLSRRCPRCRRRPSRPSPCPGRPRRLSVALGDALRLGVVAVRDRRARPAGGRGTAALDAPRFLGDAALAVAFLVAMMSSVPSSSRTTRATRESGPAAQRYEPAHGPAAAAARRAAAGGGPEPPGYGAGTSESPSADHSEPVVVATYVDLGEAEVRRPSCGPSASRRSSSIRPREV